MKLSLENRAVKRAQKLKSRSHPTHLQPLHGAALTEALGSWHWEETHGLALSMLAKWLSDSRTLQGCSFAAYTSCIFKKLHALPPSPTPPVWPNTCSNEELF